MFNHPLAPYFWIAYQIVTGTLFIWSACLIFKQHGPGRHLMLLGGVIGTIFSLAGQVFIRVALHLNWDIFSPGSSARVIEALYAVGNLGTLTSHVGLFLHATGIKRQSDRISQLEEILDDRKPLESEES